MFFTIYPYLILIISLMKHLPHTFGISINPTSAVSNPNYHYVRPTTSELVPPISRNVKTLNDGPGNSLILTPSIANTHHSLDGLRVVPIPGAEQSTSSRAKAVPLDTDPNVDQFNRSNSQNICMTPGCVKAAAEILKSMDDTVNPCDDFLQYACGNWIESHVIAEDRTKVSQSTLVTDELIDNKLRNLLEEEPNKSGPPIVGKMRTLYKSCMNVTEIERLGNEPLMSVINAMGGWPVLDIQTSALRPWTKVKSNYSSYWLERLALLRKFGFSHDVLIDLTVEPDFRNNTKNIISVLPVDLRMNARSFLHKGVNDSSVAAYFKLMIESALMLGAGEQEARKQMMDVLKFETKLAEYSLQPEKIHNTSSLHNKMNYTELQKLAPEIDWVAYFNTLWPLSNETKSRPYDPDKDEVIVTSPSYIVKVSKLINTTDPVVLTNYIMWQVVLQCAPTLGKKWRELAQEDDGFITGQQRDEPRWEHCLGSVSNIFRIPLSSLYVRTYFKSESKRATEEIVNYIRDEFIKILAEADWMDDETKKEAHAKAQAISSYIDYPDELLKDDLIEEIYEGLEFGDEYFTNIRHLRRWSRDYSFSLSKKINDNIDWIKRANAFPVTASREPSALYGILFDKSKPNYLNFGALGVIIGHEIMHSFDYSGRQFDKHGNNRNWSNSETGERFKEWAQCIIDQYSNYVVPENNISLSEVFSHGEIIANNGGLKVAFRAYNEWVKKNGEEARLRGLDLSPHQLFWVSSANVWCRNKPPEELKVQLSLNVHSFNRFRVTGPFSNSKEFSETFNCPPDAPLNPDKKCSVW